MKNIAIAIVSLLSSTFCNAQQDVIIEKEIVDTFPAKQPKNQKTVIIRLKDDKAKEGKIVVEIDGNKIKVNGKDVADMKDVDVTIGENRFYFNNSRGRQRSVDMDAMEENIRKHADGVQRNAESMRKQSDALRRQAQLYRRAPIEERVITTRMSKALLGIGMEKVDNGVKVTAITEESGAAKAGLQENDVITKMNDKAITTEMDITNLVSESKPGSVISIDYIRNGKMNSTKATLGERKDVVTWNGNWNSDRLIEMPMMPPMENFDFKYDGQMPNMKLYEMPLGNGNVFLYNSTPKLGATFMETEDTKGLEITKVDEESVAAKAGLQKGDIVTKVGDKTIKTTNDIKIAVKESKDKPFTIEYLRNGKLQKAEITFPKKMKEVSL